MNMVGGRWFPKFVADGLGYIWVHWWIDNSPILRAIPISPS